MAKKKQKPIKPLTRKEVIKQITELATIIQETPKYVPTKQRMVKDSIAESTPDELRDLINFLRCAIKYQLFDLNATRNEIKYLKKICKENGIDV